MHYHLNMKKRTTIKINETYTFELESHEGGGYFWSIVSNDESITRVQIKPHKARKDILANPIGKSLPLQVEIKAHAKGKSIVVLEEKRGWEKSIKPLNICKISITVE